MLNISNIMAAPSSKRFVVSDEAQKDLMEMGIPDVWVKSVLAIYDRRQDGVLYAPVGISENGDAVFVDHPEYLFSDQVLEV